MKTSCLVGAYLVLSNLGTLVQGASSPVPDATPYRVVERGADHQVWQRETYEPRANGTYATHVHQYIELSSGLNFFDNGQWVESKAEIDLLPDGSGAVATKGQHQVFFPADIYSGAIELVTRDGKHLHARPLGISYDDGTNTVMIATLTNSTGQILPSGNQVIYTNAFSEIAADLICTFRRSGFECDLVFRSRPPAPKDLGLNQKSTRIQLLTEFFNTSDPDQIKETENLTDGLNDQTLTFGKLKMVPGRAFMVGQPPAAIPDHAQSIKVFKQWLKLEGRKFLIEEVPYRKLRSQLQTLPSPRTTASTATSGGKVLLSMKRVLPIHRPIVSAVSSMRLASVDWKQTPGVVLDYTTVNANVTNFTFQGDTTYFINGEYNLYGTTTIEGGAVIKYGAASNSPSVNIYGPVNCQTAPYRPVIFTAMDDNSVGESISGSTGNPTGIYASRALDCYNSVTLKNLRISYANIGVVLDGGSSNLVQDCQFIHCATPVRVYESADTRIFNVLIGNVAETAISSYQSTVTAGQITAHNVKLLWINDNSTLNLTNSLLIGVTNLGSTFDGGYNATNSSDAGIFQIAGGGRHYLTTNSPYHSAGTTNLDPALLADVRTKTTYPPIIYTNQSIYGPTNFSPQAPRDTNSAPDLGYHYDPLDYAFGGCDVYTNITFTAGTAVGWFRTSSGWGWNGNHTGHAIHLADRMVATFDGKADAPDYFVRCNVAQESIFNEYDGGVGPGGITSWADQFSQDSTRSPVVRAKFTRCSMLAGEAGSYFTDDWGYMTVQAKNCEFLGGAEAGFVLTGYFTNCLFDRVWDGGQLEGWPGNMYVAKNCTWRGGQFRFSRNNAWYGTPFDVPVSIRNCAFDMTTFSVLDSESSNTNLTDYANNAFVSGAERLNLTNINDVIVTNFNWQTGWLGNYYLPSDSPLINAGSIAANRVGLYHFTTQTNQSKETNSIVDIGYHYLAVDGYGQPIDSNSDGVADYLEDANGNGLPDSWELQYFGYMSADADADPDWDGYTNWEEYLNNTDPTSAFSHPPRTFGDGNLFGFTFYSTRNPDALFTLTNGATVIGPYYNSQTAPLSNAVAWNAKLIYKITLPCMSNASAATFDSGNWVWPSDETITNEVAAILDAVRNNANIVAWDFDPQELRPWRPAELHYFKLVSDAIHVGDPAHRPVYNYQPNNRDAATLATFAPYEDIVAKGTYVDYVTDDKGSSCRTNRIWARWSMEQELGAIAASNSLATPWILLYMAADPPAGFTATDITNSCRHDAYMGLIMGGKAIEIWSGWRGRTGFSDTNFDAYLGGYLSVANDLNGALNLAPVFLHAQTQNNTTMSIDSGPATLPLYYNGQTNIYPSISWSSLVLNGTNYLFAVNSAQQTVTATFGGLPSNKRLDLFTDGVAPMPDGTFSITLPPLAVGAFLLTSNVCTVAYDAGANGTVSGTTLQTVGYGSSGSPVTPVPDTGYHFVDWSDGSTANPRTDASVTNNINVTANFAINTYTLSYTAGANGTVNGATSQTVNYHASGSAVRAVPNMGYHFVNWSDSITANPRRSLYVTGDIIVTANFDSGSPSFPANPFSVPAATANAAYSSSIAAKATDPDLAGNEVLTFSKVAGPAWLTVATNGVISGQPGYANYGTNIFTVQVVDSLGAIASATMLLPVIAPDCGATNVWSEDFSNKTLATLTNQGWVFSGQTNSAELVTTTTNSHFLGTKSYLRIGSSNVSQPFGQKVFGPVTNGQLKAIVFTTSSYSYARFKLLNSNNAVLFSFYLSTPTTFAVEGVSPTFSTNPMPNSAKHDMLSSIAFTNGGYTELTLTWGGSNVTWQAVNRNGSNGVVVYDTGIHAGTMTNAGVPSRLRLDTSAYNHPARYFGTTSIQIIDTTGTCPPGMPMITGQPQSMSVVQGSNATFSVAANGAAPLHYQWYFNTNTPVSNATNATLILSSVQPEDAGTYMVVITNIVGRVTSLNATLAVGMPPTIEWQSEDQVAVFGNANTFFVSTAGTTPLNYQWYFNTNTPLDCATNWWLTIPDVQAGDLGSYYMVATNVFGVVTSTVVALALPASPAILTQPQSLTVTQNQNAAFNILASGTSPLSYQWRFNGTSLADANESGYTLLNVQPAAAGNYSVVITNAYGSVNSSVSTLTVLSPARITAQPQSLTVTQAQNAIFSVTATGTSPLGYQWRFNGTNLAGANGSSYTQMNAQSTAAGNYSVVITNVCGSVTSRDAGLAILYPVTITTQPQSVVVTQAHNATFIVTTAGTEPMSYQWYFNTNTLLDGANNDSLLLANLQPENTGSYSVVVANAAGSVTSSVAMLTVLSPPSLATQPQSQIVLVGDSAVLSATATGTAPLSHQWYYNTNTLQTGATNSVWTLTNVQLTNAGYYSVVITNLVGSVTSRLATLVPVVVSSTNVVDSTNNVLLGRWPFTDTNEWTGAQNQRPVTFTNIIGVPSWSTNAMFIASSNPAVLTYQDVETNGNRNINLRNGTVRFWFKPDWDSGPGPGIEGRLIEVGGQDFNGWWCLMLNAAGTQIQFITQTNAAVTTNLAVTFDWMSNQWHQIALTYDSTNSMLYLDGAVVKTNGLAVTYYPGLAVRSRGFRVGSDMVGMQQAKGTFDELETFNYPLDVGAIRTNYLAAVNLDSDGDGLINLLANQWGLNPYTTNFIYGLTATNGLQVFTPLK